MRRVYRGLVHLLKGTLLERLQSKWYQHTKPRRQAWWESQVDKHVDTLIRIQPGIRLRLYLDSQLCRMIYCDEFEWKERQFLIAFLRPGDVFVDIGANIGLFTLIAAKRVGKTGQVYAFEPSSKTFQRLLANVELNHLTNVSCQQVALSDSTTQLDMNVSLDGFDAWNSFARPIAGNSFTNEVVTCITWDSFAEQRCLIGRVTMMKIDVEGWESCVLSGGYKILSRSDAPILQIEFTEQACHSAGSSCAKLYHQLEDLGYMMFIYDAKSRKLVPDPLRDSYPYLNLIAAKQPEQVVSRLVNHSQLTWLRG